MAGFVHFVGFRGEEFHSAVKVWGKPTFIHFKWDKRAKAEVEPEDTVIFARVKDWENFDTPSPFNHDDSSFL